eukprot:6195285-Pleurochrysis_carterae.AAC.2
MWLLVPLRCAFDQKRLHSAANEMLDTQASAHSQATTVKLKLKPQLQSALPPPAPPGYTMQAPSPLGENLGIPTPSKRSGAALKQTVKGEAALAQMLQARLIFERHLSSARLAPRGCLLRSWPSAPSAAAASTRRASRRRDGPSRAGWAAEVAQSPLEA